MFWNENSDNDTSIKPRLSDGINRNGISEHGTLSSDSIGKKVIATKKSGFYFTVGYNKQVKWQN